MGLSPHGLGSKRNGLDEKGPERKLEGGDRAVGLGKGGLEVSENVSSGLE